MRRVFVDTSGFFAHFSVGDIHHRKAAQLFEDAVDQNWRLTTSNAVVFETYALFQTRLRNGTVMALRFLDRLEVDLCDIERVMPEDEAKARVLVRKHRDKDYSLCDASSFMLMERLGIIEAISFDRHFKSYGKVTVL